MAVNGISLTVYRKSRTLFGTKEKSLSGLKIVLFPSDCPPKNEQRKGQRQPSVTAARGWHIPVEARAVPRQRYQPDTQRST